MKDKLGVIRAGCFALSGVLFLSFGVNAQDKEKFAQAQQQNKEAQTKMEFVLEQPLVVPYVVRVASSGVAP
jgi:hypothetical protein